MTDSSSPTSRQAAALSGDPTPVIGPHERLSVHDLRQRFPGGVTVEMQLQDADFLRLRPEGISLPQGLRLLAVFTGESLRLSVQAVLELACRRCAEPLHRPLRVERRFQLFDNSAEADAALDVDSEEFETLATQDEATLVSLVEDEILLDCLAAPAHDDCDLQAVLGAGRGGAARSNSAGNGQDDSAQPGAVDRIRPFAQLAELMKRQSDK